MALYTEDFAAQTLGAAPAGWTPRWNVDNANWSVIEGGIVGGRFLRQASSGTHRRLITLDAVDSDAGRADADILALIRTTHASLNQCYLMARAANALGAETGYFAALYNGSQLRIHRYLNGTSTQLAAADYAWSENTWYWARFRANGTSLLAKIWQEHEPEPAGWLVSTTDSEITDPGWVGVQSYEYFGDNDFDYVGIGTGGDAAAEFDNTGPLRTSQLALESLSQPDSPAGRLSQLTLETLNQPTPAGRLSQLTLEVLSANLPEGLHYSQHVLEAVAKRAAQLQYSQQVLEAVVKRPGVQLTPSTGQRSVRVVS